VFSVAAEPRSETLGCGEGEDFIGGVGTEFMGPEVGRGRFYCTFFSGEDLVGSEKSVVGGRMEKGLDLGYDVGFWKDEFCGGEKVWGGRFMGQTCVF